jgi:FkbM family methyltransferase
MIPASIKHKIRKSGLLVFGKEPRIHLIPFGRASGLLIYMSFDISPRMFLGIDERQVAKWAEQYIKPGDIVFDIGAHIGYTSLIFRRLIRETGIIHAFEILPSVAREYFEKTMSANRFDNVTIHPVGVGNSNEDACLMIGETMMTSIASRRPMVGQKCEVCTIVKLDEYSAKGSLPGPALIKIDIEGAEVACLKGAYRILNEYHPTLIIEFHDKELLIAGYELLSSLKYRCFNKKRELKKQNIYKLKTFHESVLCLPCSR